MGSAASGPREEALRVLLQFLLLLLVPPSLLRGIFVSFCPGLAGGCVVMHGLPVKGRSARPITLFHLCLFTSSCRPPVGWLRCPATALECLTLARTPPQEVRTVASKGRLFWVRPT